MTHLLLGWIEERNTPIKKKPERLVSVHGPRGRIHPPRGGRHRRMRLVSLAESPGPAGRSGQDRPGQWLTRRLGGERTPRTQYPTTDRNSHVHHVSPNVFRRDSRQDSPRRRRQKSIDHIRRGPILDVQIVRELPHESAGPSSVIFGDLPRPKWTNKFSRMVGGIEVHRQPEGSHCRHRLHSLASLQSGENGRDAEGQKDRKNSDRHEDLDQRKRDGPELRSPRLQNLSDRHNLRLAEAGADQFAATSTFTRRPLRSNLT